MKRIIVSLVLLFLTGTRNFSQADHSASSQFRNAGINAGFYTDTRLTAVGDPAWKFATGSAIRSTPAIHDGKVYVGSSDCFFYCLDQASGRQRWKFQARAAINSSPAVYDGHVYFTDRRCQLYCVNENTGIVKWQRPLGKPMQYEWAFDCYRSSPVIVDHKLFVGSLDGNLYVLDPSNGETHWEYYCGAVILATPVVHGGRVFFGDANGIFHALTIANGRPAWTFRTHGETMDNVRFGFDRRGILSSAAIEDGRIFFGSRDGFLYALDEGDGKKLWEMDYNISWVISSAAIARDMLVTATSDGHYINAVSCKDGTERWRFRLSQPVWSSPIVCDTTVVVGANDGCIYSLALSSGTEISRQRIGEKIFSSPVYDDGKIFIGADDGRVYAFQGLHNPLKSACRAVFWMKDPPAGSPRFGLDLFIRDYFLSEGYDRIGEQSIDSILMKRIDDHEHSVIVFATNYFPPSILRGNTKQSLLYRYLAAGGKVVVLGLNPVVYDYDATTGEFKGLDYSQCEQVLGFGYGYKDLRSNRGPLGSVVTETGREMGLTGAIVSTSPMDPSKVLMLARNEDDLASYWIKNFGGPRGTGFVQLWFSPANISSIDEIRKVAEYGL